MPRPGRPSAFTPQARAAVIKAVEEGCPRHLAAASAGVGRSTFHRWLAAGRTEKSGEYKDFWDAVKKAEGKAVLQRVKKIKAAGGKTWQAAAWWLERRYPHLFGADRRELADLRKELRHLSEQLAAMKGASGGQGGQDDPHRPPQAAGGDEPDRTADDRGPA